jgi:hypothetical protein
MHLSEDVISDLGHCFQVSGMKNKTGRRKRVAEKKLMQKHDAAVIKGSMNARYSETDTCADQVVERISVALVNGLGVQAIGWHLWRNWQFGYVGAEGASEGNFPGDCDVGMDLESGGGHASGVG